MSRTYRKPRSTYKHERTTTPVVVDAPENRVIVEMFQPGETMLKPTLLRTSEIDGNATTVYLTVSRDVAIASKQSVCTHSNLIATRMGDAICGCGTALWAPEWVASGVMGDDTLGWINTEEVRLTRRAMTGA